MASTVETLLPRLGQEFGVASRLALMRASWLSTSTCGWTSRRRSPRAPLARNEWWLTKEALGLPAEVRGAKDKYTLEAELDQPCRFHSTPGRVATHSTRQCNFIKELQQRTRQLPGLPPE
jgi:hypothetical protein